MTKFWTMTLHLYWNTWRNTGMWLNEIPPFSLYLSDRRIKRMAIIMVVTSVSVRPVRVWWLRYQLNLSACSSGLWVTKLTRPEDVRCVFGGSSWNIILCTRSKCVQPNQNTQFISENVTEISCTKIRLHKVLNAPQQGAAAILQYCENNNKARIGNIIRFRS